MAGKEGFIGNYQEFNKITRNGALGIAFIAAFLGYSGLAAVALGAAALDQVQISLIDSWQYRNK